MDCIFCKILKGEIGADVVLKEDGIFAFKDIKPQAPHHILIIPEKHIATINDLGDEDAAIVGKMVLAAKKIAKKLGVQSYRLVFNCNADAGQEVFHIHLHFLAGRKFTWPPG